MDNRSFLFIPDISGFTKFMTENELEHSNHIITELLEAIINANQLDLAISEVEGDAVLTYRKGAPPTIAEVIDQARTMFIDFHTFLKTIERDNVCQCGACTTASQLTLKFVAHYGELSEVKVGNFAKIMGRDVILAHRLLKNGIEKKEYLLMTNQYLRSQGQDLADVEDWVEYEPCLEEFANFGAVHTQYIPLTPLLPLVPTPPELEPITIEGEPLQLAIDINAPVLTVHGELTDSTTKFNWVDGLKDVVNEGKINRVNMSHTCIFEDFEVHIVTKRNTVDHGEYTYVEHGSSDFGLDAISSFTLTESPTGGTHLVLNVTPGANMKLPQAALEQLFEGLKANMAAFKGYCERLAAVEA